MIRKTDMPRNFMPQSILEPLDVRFLLIGCLNITIGYVLFAAFIILSLPTALALLLSTIVGVLFKYCSSGRLVFSWRTSACKRHDCADSIGCSRPPFDLVNATTYLGD